MKGRVPGHQEGVPKEIILMTSNPCVLHGAWRAGGWGPAGGVATSLSPASMPISPALVRRLLCLMPDPDTERVLHVTSQRQPVDSSPGLGI